MFDDDGSAGAVGKACGLPGLRTATRALACMADPAETILAYLHQVGAGIDPDFLRETVRVMSALLMEIEVKRRALDGPREGSVR